MTATYTPTPPAPHDVTCSMAAERRARHASHGRRKSQIEPRIHAEREAGASFEAIAEHLNADGMPAIVGGRWYPGDVARVFRWKFERRRKAVRIGAAIIAAIGAVSGIGYGIATIEGGPPSALGAEEPQSTSAPTVRPTR